MTPVDASGLITPAHYFDLLGKTIRFDPSRQGFVVTTSKARPLGNLGTRLEPPDYPSFRSAGWRRTLPFAFPYAGHTWHELFINSAGNLTFQRPEAQMYPERDTWADGTVQSVAGSINDRAAAGQEKMISALWGLYSWDAGIFVRRSPDEFVVTWQVERYIWLGEAYTPLGPNIFQARLTPDGAIEFTYHQVSEKDGIVGLFYGDSDVTEFATFKTSKNAPDPRLQIRSAGAALSGRTLRFTFHMAGPILSSVPTGMLWYRIFLRHGSDTCEIGYAVSRNTHPYLGRGCAGVPAAKVDGNTLSLYASTFETDLPLGPGIRWYADVLWARGENDDVKFAAGEDNLQLPARLSNAIKLSGAKDYYEGNIFEVFHYPRVSKNVLPHLRYIYQRFAPQDDMAVVVTDFRIDDLHNHQGSTGGGYNVPIQGIGRGPAQTDEDNVMGSKKLQVATGPIYLGPRFSEYLEDGDTHYRNYANAVGWMAHELGHRWGMQLQMRDPKDGRTVDLTSPDNHWSDFLNTPSMYPVWRMFSDKPYSEKSQMEGFVFQELPNGVFRRIPDPWNMPTGFSALDLYTMGLIRADEVPDTFLLEKPYAIAPDLFRGVRTTVRIQDVISALGERRPSVAGSQKEFVIGIYLLHEHGRPPYPDKLKQAQGIEKALIDYYRVATGGRMRLEASK